MDSMDWMERWIQKFGISPFWSLIIVFLIVCLFKYDKVRLLLNDLICWSSKICGWLKKRSTKISIEKLCQNSLSSLAQEAPELDLPRFRIEWVNGELNSFNEGEGIVCLKYDKDNTQNIINATTEYVKNAILPTAKIYMAPEIKEAIDYTVIKICLSKIPNNRYATNRFIKDNQEIVTDNKDEINKVININDAGLLSRILFREFDCWGNALSGREALKKYEEESSKFLDYLYEIATRNYDENTPLQFVSENIKVGVLLVARSDKYLEKGEEPYVRRIRDGFSKGIRTFYLLARNKKVGILEEVYAKLFESGSYELLNGPKEFLDKEGRTNICYCIEVTENSNIAETFENVNKAISSVKTIDVTINQIMRDRLKCFYFGIPVLISYDKITEKEGINLNLYFKQGMSVGIVPESIENGCIIGNMLKSSSNPESMLERKYSIGSEVIVIVSKALDDRIYVNINNSSTTGVAYRSDITFSHYDYLHKLYPVDSELALTIADIDYTSNQLILKRSDLIDPWKEAKMNIGDEVSCVIYEKRANCLCSELFGGVKAILPHSELTWFDIDTNLIKSIKLGDSIKCRIERIDFEKRIVILSHKAIQSPYSVIFNSLNTSQKVVSATIIDVNSSGAIALYDNKYRVFIPTHEMRNGDIVYHVKPNQKCNVCLINIAEDKRSLIGSIRRLKSHPIKWFNENYSEGNILKSLHLKGFDKRGLLFDISANGSNLTGLLPISEISEHCFVSSPECIFSHDTLFPLMIKEIDMDKCLIRLSLKDLFKHNIKRVNNLDYKENYQGVVLGKKYRKTIIAITKIWVEGFFTSNKEYKVGEILEVHLISRNNNFPEFADE